MIRSSHRKSSVKRCVLKNFAKFTGKPLCQSLVLTKLQACNFIKKETLTQMFSREFCEIFKNTFVTEQPQTTASCKLANHCSHVELTLLKNVGGLFLDITSLQFNSHLQYLIITMETQFMTVQKMICGNRMENMQYSAIFIISRGIKGTFLIRFLSRLEDSEREFETLKLKSWLQETYGNL